MSLDTTITGIVPTGGASPALVRNFPCQEASSATVLTDTTTNADTATPSNLTHFLFGADAGAVGGIAGEKCLHLDGDSSVYTNTASIVNIPTGNAPFSVFYIAKSATIWGDEVAASWGTFGTDWESVGAGTSDSGGQPKLSLWGHDQRGPHAMHMDQRWAALGFVYDGTNVIFYAHGEEVYRTVPGTALNVVIGSLYLFGFNSSSYFNGWLSHLAIWKGIVAPVDQRALATATGFYIPPAAATLVSPLDTALGAFTIKSHYTFNEPTGSSAIRDVVSGNHAAVGRMTLGISGPIPGQTCALLSNSDFGDNVGAVLINPAWFYLDGSHDFSIVAVCKPIGNNNNIPLSVGDRSATRSQLEMKLDGGSTLNIICNADDFSQSFPGGGAASDQWDLLVYTYTASGAHRYCSINGVPTAVADYGGSVAITPDHGFIGYEHDDNGSNMYLARVVVLDQHITDGQIATLWAALQSSLTPRTVHFHDVLYALSGVPMPGGKVISVLDTTQDTLIENFYLNQALVPNEVTAIADGSGVVDFTLVPPLEVEPNTPYLVTVLDATGKYSAQFLSALFAYSSTTQQLDYLAPIVVDPTKIPFYYIARGTDGAPVAGVPLTVQINANSTITGYSGIESADTVQRCVTDSAGVGHGFLTKTSLLQAHRWYIVTFGASKQTVLLRNCPDSTPPGGYDILDPSFANPGT